MDDQQRARELAHKIGVYYTRKGSTSPEDGFFGFTETELQEFVAALRAAPEGFVMVKTSALDGISTAAEACWAQSQDKSFAEWVRDRANGEARGLNAALTMLTARPQGGE